MVIKVRVTFKDYLKLMFGLTYRKPIMILLLFVDLVMILWIVGYFFNLLSLPQPTIYQFTTLILISVVQPFVIYITIRRNYQSSNHLGERLEIGITGSEIKIHGQSFYMELKWDKIYKIIEHVNWYLIYQNNLSAIVIPKKAFHKDEEENFIKILMNTRKVPMHLKEK